MLRGEALVPAHAPHCCVVPGDSRTRARRPGGVEPPRGGRCWSRPVAAGFLLPPWLSPAMGRRRRAAGLGEGRRAWSGVRGAQEVTWHLKTRDPDGSNLNENLHPVKCTDFSLNSSIWVDS
ncbi:transmembrane protein 51 isoform X2 [Dermochelys coriacea]|uniref:transmembrane protein 51 isoform X2 n=1 Tax=Dermochelys coriacea TaxID=27794 RepID=UPI0018E78A15|nr:transmembrane protein 51 isoform X2 [Dermochelys coriacea]